MAKGEKAAKKAIKKYFYNEVPGIYLDRNNLFHGRVNGPAGSPFYGGVLHFEIEFGNLFPGSAPVIRFITKMYHPNIDAKGRAVLSSLSEDQWRPTTPLSRVMEDLLETLATPNLKLKVNYEAAHQYKTQYQKYYQNARSLSQM